MGKEFDREGESMTNKPQKKRFKETSKRLRQGKENNLGHRASLDWRHDSAGICEPAAKTGHVVEISELVAAIMQSRTGAALLSVPGAESLEIRYDMQSPASQYYPRADKPVITLNPFRPRGDLLNLLSRELRRLWQHRHGALVNPLSFDPDEAILVNRAQAADALMVSIRIAWELKLAGDQEAWNWIAGSPMADVGRTFEIKAREDFRTLNNGEAARAAYDKFFEDSRTKMHDKRIIHQMLLDETGYMRAKRRKDTAKAAPPPKVSSDLFHKLGEMPDGRNYLAIRNGKAPTDPVYTAVEDRSNANFLWFIKFERSFQEKEMQMIEESVKLSAEIVDFAKWSSRREDGDGSSNAGL